MNKKELVTRDNELEDLLLNWKVSFNWRRIIRKIEPDKIRLLLVKLTVDILELKKNTSVEFLEA